MNIPQHLKAEFKIEFKDSTDAEVVLRSIEVEMESSPSQRSSVRANLNKNVLNLMINACDVPSLRASINSYLRWIILSNDVKKLKIN